MKKWIAALIIVALLLGSTAAMAVTPSLIRGRYAQFRHDTKVFSQKTFSADTGTVVSRDSIGFVEAVSSDWTLVRLSDYGEEGNFSDHKGRFWGGWVRTSSLKDVGLGRTLNVRYRKGGFGVRVSLPGNPLPGTMYRDTTRKKHIMATASVWLHRTYGLSKNYGKALRKGQKVTYRHLVGIDKRGVKFYAVRYEGKNLWVSSRYSKIVK